MFFDLSDVFIRRLVHVSSVPPKARREDQIPWSWGHRHLSWVLC